MLTFVCVICGTYPFQFVFVCVCVLRCLPMNLLGEDLTSGVLRDRAKVGASLADVDPMNIDSSVRLYYYCY